MCYLVIERYSVCRCLYYKHTVDTCGLYGTEGHGIQERTVLVGYSCQNHSDHRGELWSSGNNSTNPKLNGGTSSEAPGSIQPGIKITSTIALRALDDAQMMERDDVLTERSMATTLETASSQTTIENDPGNKFHFSNSTLSTHPSNLEDFRSRLRHPHEYITSLQELEEKVWSNSIIALYKECISDGLYKSCYGPEDYIPYPVIPSEIRDILPGRLSDDPFTMDPTNTSDIEITTVCNSTRDRAGSSQLNSIRMCRNIVLRTFLNLKLLQKSDFCSQGFSIVVLDRRRQNVAMLLPIENTDFIALAYEIEYILRDSASLVLSTKGSQIPANINRKFEFLHTPMVEKYCRTILQIDSKNPLDPQSSTYGVVNVLRALVMTLDLAVASYAGAHCSDFLGKTFPANDSIALLSPFSDCSEMSNKGSVSLQCCSLQCLDSFHHGKGVWTFIPSGCEASLPLYLSTSIESFSDVWGPLWKLSDHSNSEKYSSYIVGGGSIVQWQHDSSTSPKLFEQRFCHWLSNDELEDGRGPEISYIPFDGTEILLIGAPSHPAAAQVNPWRINRQCSNSISAVRNRLHEAGRLCIIGASKPYHYNDSNQYQLQVGYSGVNVSATRQYKRVDGHSFKDILVELWAMEPAMRDPKLLEDLHGIEISTCTCNAQRVSLTEVLRTKCMQHLLRDFDWQDPQYRTEHFLTLEDTLRPQRLLNVQFKEKFDYAVMLGLKMLSKSGVDRQDNLNVLLSSSCTPKPELATIISKEHTWIGLLKDTIHECTMAIFGDSCLEFEYGEGVSCGTAGHSTLRSAMVPHSSMLASSPPARLKLSAHNASESGDRGLRWDVSTIAAGKVFSLGVRGKLRLKSTINGTALVMGWNPTSVNLAFMNKLSRQPVIMHREYTEVDHSEEGKLAQPVPIFVVSDQRRVMV